ncbi:MAG: chemoreceptor glutamine deamidase CheD [Burkholderiales bacterium]|nr:chemoreceptor glutamine deamidase CheD [Burkholderiales bacterium]
MTPPNLYFDTHFQRDTAKIVPGEYYATARDMLLVTVLGSCVCACLRDRVNGIAGMNHFMLPDKSSNIESSPTSLPARYGAYAMEALINEMLKLGAQRRYMEAKIFGGADVLQGLGGNMNVGRRNAEFIQRYLQAEAIQMVAHDLLGHQPRKVYFFCSSGKVMVKRIKALNNDTLLQREFEYRAHLLRDRLDGDVVLFDETAEKSRSKR